MKLFAVLKDWNGKETESLEKAFAMFSADGDFPDKLIGYAENGKLRRGSLWLLKKYLEDGGELDGRLTRRLVFMVPYFVDWESRLLLLQSLPLLELGFETKDPIELFIRKSLASKNKFVRAWAFNALYDFADRFPEYREEARRYIETAMENESAAVKARLRNALKKGFLSGS